MPGPVEIRNEIRIQDQRDIHMTAINQYVSTHCDNKGMIKQSENLTERECKGKSQILEGITNQGWMLYSTDKSGKMYLDTVSKYKDCISEHVRKDHIVTSSAVREGELLMNNHTRQWVRFARIGENHNHIWRVNRALISNYLSIPPLMGLRKDHKGDIDDNPEKGLKLRPLCLANI